VVRCWRSAAVLLLLQSAMASAQPPLGDEFEINSYTTGNQQRTAIAAGPAGDFVVAWSSQGSTGSDTSNYSIQARRFDASGAPLGSQFQVNSYTTQSQTYPSVARDAVGNFVVVWESDENSGSIKGQRYDSAGTPIGGEFPVSTTEAAFRPTVSMNGDGSFVSAWVGSTFGAGSEFARVLGQRFATDGAPVGAEFQVNTLTTNNQWFPAVAVLPGGGFIVAFGSFASAGTDTDGQSVQARLYDANGTPLGAEFQVNTFTPEAQTFPEVAVDAFGGFVIAWHSTFSSADINGGEIRARRYSAAGAIPQGDDFQINTYTTGHQQFPDVAMDPNGGFVVAWENVDVMLPVQARRYDSSGAPLGDQFTVSPNGGAPPHVAMDAASRFIAVFETFLPTSGSTEISGRRFAAPPGPIPVKVAVIVQASFQVRHKGQFHLPDPRSTTRPSTAPRCALSGASSQGCTRCRRPAGEVSVLTVMAQGLQVQRHDLLGHREGEVIRACKGDTGSFSLPESGPSRFNSPWVRRTAAQRPGAQRQPDKIFKQTDCSAPSSVRSAVSITSGGRRAVGAGTEAG
jgi:hypothetical protein